MHILRLKLVFILFLLVMVANSNPVQAQIADDKLTPLMRAAEAGNVDDLRELLKAGADVNEALGRLGITALTLAAGRGHLEVVKLLLSAGADPNAAGGVAHVGFFTVLTYAMNPHNKNRLEIIDALIAAGARLNPPNWWPVSPLDAAVSSNDIAMVKELLKRGGDVNWENQIGSTALVTAILVSERNVEMVRLLLEADANPNKPRLSIGNSCVSILTFLDERPGVPRDKVREEIRRLIVKAGGKRYSKNSRGEPCNKYHER
ncbi:MAG TPA: ankyrin repeat domain-containing protein [Pyrinomonadaceae bacterium]